MVAIGRLVLRDRSCVSRNGFERPQTGHCRHFPASSAIAAVAVAWIIATPAALAAGSVSVLYAGSLVNLMEHGTGPAFDKASGDEFRGYAGGSNLLANQIKGKLRRGDVFISANPAVNGSLMGEKNGNWVSWYVSFAQSPLVLGYNPTSRFAADFKSKPWYQVLMEPGIRIGRTDPKLDPKGALTLALMNKAEAYYKVPGLAQRVLGAPDNPAQVLPEETLIGRLQSGQLDVGFFYSTETASAKIPEVRLPAGITPKAVYTATILRGAPNPQGAVDFVSFLLGPQGKKVMTENGLDVQKPALAGILTTVPLQIRALVDQDK
ncbi:MAG: extracellular solute-binding protein [Alphaproteobacteria bacterium]|nr:extracellular solute-binding protein [Alphaproteobacteria bacterium]